MFCESGIFNQIVKIIDQKYQKTCSLLHYATEEGKIKIAQNLNLFYLTVLAFEIIDHCEILNRIYRETRQLLERSVKLVEEVVKEEWPRTILERFMQNLIEQEQKSEKK